MIGAFVLLVLLHNWATPLFEAPDEVWHYAYVRWLAEGHGLPAMDDDSSGAGQEVAQPPLYYSVAALLSAPFSDVNLESLFWHNPNFGYQAQDRVPDNKNMLIHTQREHFPWRGAVLAVHVTRLISLLFGALTVASSWGLGYAALDNRKAALLTAALVAFQPQFVFISSVVSNDSASAALSTLALWLTVRTFRRGLTYQQALIIGAVVGLSTLTKTSTLLLIPIIGTALLWTVLQDRYTWRKGLAQLSLYITAVFVVGSWWYIRNYALYGDPLGISSHVNTPWGRSALVPLVRLLPEFPLLIRSFWGAYGWGHVFWPDLVYGFLTIGALFFALRAMYDLTQAGRLSKTSRMALILTIGWMMAIFAALLRWMQQVEAPHGRLLFPVIGAWALWLTAGMQIPRKGRWVSRGFLMSMAILAALAPGTRILATFAPPRLYKPATVTTKRTRVNLTYGERARLLSTSVSPARLAPGDTLDVEACWEAIQPMKEDYAVFVQVLGPENIQIASRRTYPGLGRFPTSLWPAGQAFCDTYRMEIASWAEAPLRYQIEIGLFNPDNTTRLQAREPTGTPIEIPIAANVIVEAELCETVETETLPVAQLGESIRLQQYNITSRVRSGKGLTVTLTWEALSPIDEEWISFVHLWEPGASEPLAQSDASPRNGWYPTSVWQEGDCVPDTHVLTLPADLAPGRYPLWAGMYRPDEAIRLPAIGPTGRYPYDLIPLGEVVVE